MLSGQRLARKPKDASAPPRFDQVPSQHTSRKIKLAVRPPSERTNQIFASRSVRSTFVLINLSGKPRHARTTVGTVAIRRVLARDEKFRLCILWLELYNENRGDRMVASQRELGEWPQVFEETSVLSGRDRGPREAEKL